MGNESIITNKVELIDPNKVNNSKYPNGIPPYEDMFIYVKLTAAKRSNTILQDLSFNGKFNNITTIDGDMVVSFLG